LVWALIGIPGLREIVLIAVVALALYGRSGSRLLMASRHGRALAPWVSLVRDATGLGAGTGRGSRKDSIPRRARALRGPLFWVLTFMAAAALAWIATRAAILSGVGAPR
jgi:Na+(H+)/acetate symporter ActP